VSQRHVHNVGMVPDKPHLLNATETLTSWLAENGEKPFRARQIRRWIDRGRAESFAEMTDLPQGLRERLADAFTLLSTEILKHSVSGDGTEKLLLGLADGHQVECVLLRDGERRTICISSQVGCAMGCVFCASGIGGVTRNLTDGEIYEQALRLQRLLPEEERLSHIVMMGMGEPLANLDNVLAALERATSPNGLGIGSRRITISTVGLPKMIDRLIDRGPKFHLAVSLHAPNEELRQKIVPVSKQAGLMETLAAADRYFQASGRRLTFEYVLLAGVNDQSKHARQLAALLSGRTAMVNLIPYNPVVGLAYATPTPAAVHKFRQSLEAAGLNVQIRERKGDDISAACGQLRRAYLQQSETRQISLKEFDGAGPAG